MTARSPLLAVQTAIYEKLSQDATLSGMAGVYDHVPEDAEHPYVEIGETTQTADNTLDGFGRQQVVTLHVWSKHRGFKEALQIEDRLTELLDHQPLTLSGFDHVFTKFEFGQTLKDPDPEIRHVVFRLRVATEQVQS